MASVASSESTRRLLPEISPIATLKGEVAWLPPPPDPPPELNISLMSARLSPPLLSHDIEGSLPEEDGLLLPDKKSNQLDPPSFGPEDEFAEELETRGIYINDRMR